MLAEVDRDLDCSQPELLLGIYFMATGSWYALMDAPYLFPADDRTTMLDEVLEWGFALGAIPYLRFLQTVFRPHSAWAAMLVVVATLCLLTGATWSSLGAGFTNSLDDPAFLIQWVGYATPCCWITVEGFLAHVSAKRRMLIGLCDPGVVNRYLLFACFGLAQTTARGADLLWAFDNTVTGHHSDLSTELLSGAEFLSVAFLWLAFFPPTAYQNWIRRRSAVA